MDHRHIKFDSDRVNGFGFISEVKPPSKKISKLHTWLNKLPPGKLVQLPTYTQFKSECYSADSLSLETKPSRPWKFLSLDCYIIPREHSSSRVMEYIKRVLHISNSEIATTEKGIQEESIAFEMKPYDIYIPLRVLLDCVRKEVLSQLPESPENWKELHKFFPHKFEEKLSYIKANRRPHKSNELSDEDLMLALDDKNGGIRELLHSAAHTTTKAEIQHVVQNIPSDIKQNNTIGPETMNNIYNFVDIDSLDDGEINSQAYTPRSKRQPSSDLDAKKRHILMSKSLSMDYINITPRVRSDREKELIQDLTEAHIRQKSNEFKDLAKERCAREKKPYDNHIPLRILLDCARKEVLSQLQRRITWQKLCNGYFTLEDKMQHVKSNLPNGFNKLSDEALSLILDTGKGSIQDLTSSAAHTATKEQIEYAMQNILPEMKRRITVETLDKFCSFIEISRFNGEITPDKYTTRAVPDDSWTEVPPGKKRSRFQKL